MSKTCFKNLFNVSIEFNSKHSCITKYYIIRGRVVKLTDIINNKI